MAGRSITVTFLGKDKSLGRTLDGVEGKTSKLGDRMRTIGRTIGAGLAVAAGAAVAFGVKSVGAASDLNETLSKSKVIFGDQFAAMSKWGDGAARTMGLSKAAALDAAAGFGDMFRQLGYSGKEAASTSREVVQLSADLGSFNNLPTAEVADMMSAAFRGEYDSLQRLIPNINAARVEKVALAQTGKTLTSQLTAEEKATATLAIVQEDGARAAGDFARTSGGLANQKKILAAQVENLSAKLGAKLLPAVTTVVTWFNDRGLPALTSFGQSLMKVARFVDDNKVAIGALVVAMTALVAITKIHAAVMAVQAAGGLLKYLAATNLVTTATKVWTAVQWLLNAALWANPITWVIAGLVALGAGLVIAYKKSETFRNIVDGALRLVGKAAKWLWDNAFSPAFSAIKKIIQVVGQAGIWLWNKALAPAFRAILKGVAWVLDGWAKMLRNLAKVPGFEWADRAADKMQRAADKARRVADGIRDIPTRKDVSIYVTTYTARRNIDTGPGGGGGRAHGTTNFPGGAAWVGEQGPELVSLPKGTRIWSAARSERMVGSLGGGRGGVVNNYNITINGPHDTAGAARAVEALLLRRLRDTGRPLAFMPQ